MTLTKIIFWLAVLLTLPPAQSDDLTLRVSAGFDGLYKAAAPVPIYVNARNAGPAVEGEIRVSTGDAAAGTAVTYSAPISLPTQSDKRVLLYAHVPPFTGDLSVQLVSDGQVLAQERTNPLNQTAGDDLLYGVVSPNPGGLAFLETISGSRPDADVAFLEMADLPDVSVAWNALDVLIFDDIDTSRLTAGQLSALRAWVENGGQLIVTGGPGGPKTAAGVADLLPVTVTGIESVDALPALNSFAVATAPASGPYTLTTSSPRSGELIISQGELPILAQVERGLGNITFLALDPNSAPLAGWEGHTRLWERVAEDIPARPPWGNGVQDYYGAGQAVSSIPGLRLPSVWQLALFLAIYISVIGPVNYLVLRRLNRRELAWITIPALVLLFTAVTYFTSFRTRGSTAVLNEMSIAYGSIEAERVRTQTILGLYSPRRDRFDLALPYDGTAYPFSTGLGATATGANLDAIIRAGDLTLSDVRTDTSELATFVADAHLPRPPLSGEVRQVEGGSMLEVSVRNDGDSTFEDAVIVYGQEQIGLGDIPAGEVREVTLLVSAPSSDSAPAPDPLFTTGTFAPNPLINDPSYILGTPDYFSDAEAFPRWQLLQSLYFGSESGVTAPPDPSEAVTLGGWFPGSPQAVDTGDETASRSAMTLVLLEIPVRLEIRSGK